MKRLAIWVLLCILVTGGTSTGFASTGERIPWQVKDLGTFYVPVGWQATQISLNKEFLAGQTTEEVLKTATVDMPNGRMNPVDLLGSLDINVYQVTLKDDDAYHLAWLVFCKDTKKMTSEEREYFSQQLTEGRKAAINNFVSRIDSGATQQFFNGDSGFELLEMLPVEYLRINKKQAFACGGRVLITANELRFPCYGKGYIFDAKGYMALALLITPDGERIFWDPVLRRVMNSLNRW